MDYFSELLESYSKLKKRTYKLTFLTEDSKAATSTPEADQAAKEILSIINGVGQSGKPQEQKGISFTAPEAEKAAGDTPGAPLNQNPAVTVKGFSGKWQSGKKAKLNGAKSWSEILSPQKIKDTRSAGYALVSAWLGGGETEGMRQDAEINQISAEEQEKRNNRTIEGSVAGTEYEVTGKILSKGFEDLQKLISDKIVDMTSDTALAQFVKGNHGTRAGGFMKQILQGEVRKMNQDGTKSVKGGTVSPAMAESMARKFNTLATCPGIQEGTQEAKEFCEKVSNEDSPMIGMYKGSPVLYGADKTESLVFPTVNKILDGALNHIEKLCGKTKSDLSQVPTDSVNSNALNGIRGTFFEDITVFVFNIKAAKTQKERKLIAEDFKKLIKEKRGDLEQIVARYGGEDAATLDLDLFGEADYQQELFEVLNSAPAFKEYLYKELSLVNGLVDSLGAVSADRTGGGKAAGGDRDDIVVYFASQSDAEAAGKKLKVEPYEEEGEWKISLGSKRYTAGTEGKLGEVNSDEQLSKNMDPRFAGNSNYNAEGMRPRILKELFGWNGKDFTYDDAIEKWESSYDYYKGIQDKVDKLKSSFVETEAYSLNGKVRLQTPKARAEALLDRLKKTTGYSDLTNSPLSDVLYTKNKSGEMELINLEDPTTRERLAEKVGRMYKMQQLDKGLKNEATATDAKNAVMLMAYSTGGNVRDLSQVFTTNESTTAFSQTGLIKDLANVDPSNVKINGFTITISEGKKKLQVGLERSGKNTRTVCKTDKESMDAMGESFTPTREDASTIHDIIKGQINLLEAFLNQTNDNPPL
jgi:hypothetical protein